MLLDDFPRGVVTRPGDHKTPAAQWADPESVAADADWKYSPRKILLGKIGNRFIGMSDDSGAPDDRHVVTLAGSRSGKGVSAVIPNLIAGYKGSALVIDPKAEAASITACRRAEGLGQTVYVLDPFGVAKGEAANYRANYNPLSILKPNSDTLVEDTALIGDALVLGSERDMHWDESARNFIEGIILHVATYPAYEGRRSLVTVRELLMKGATVRHGDKERRGYYGLHVEMLHNAETLDSEAASVIEGAATDFFEKPENERGSVLSTAQRHTKFLDLPRLYGALTGEGFELTTLKSAPEGVTIYLCLPASRMAMCGRWFRLFINLAVNAMERVAGPPATGLQTLFLMDEFHVLGHMEVIATAAALVAGSPYHVKLWPILQDLPQLQRHYEKTWETFLGNAGVIQAFGNSDLTTLKFLSERLGTTTLEVERGAHVTQARQLRAETGQSWSPEVHPLLTLEEIARHFDRDDTLRRQLIIRAGKRPLVLSRAVYHEDPAFDGLYENPGKD